MLENEVGVVIGASTGIGRATAKALAAEGVQVVVAARRTSKLREVAAEIEDDGGDALVVPTDVREVEQIRSLIEATREEYGTVDVFVNSAGVANVDSFPRSDLQGWERQMEVNLLGLMNATNLAAEVMLEQGSGHIVNISSLSGRHPNPERAGYVASKFGVSGFTRSVHLALRQAGIRVTLIEPGKVDTPMHSDEYRERIPMLDPENVADAVVFSVTQPESVCVSNVQILTNGT